AELIARVLKLKAQKKFDEAEQALISECPALLGIDFSAVALVDSTSAAMLLGNVARIRTFARLLEELADVHRLQGDEKKAQRRRQHALEMYREALAKKKDDA